MRQCLYGQASMQPGWNAPGANARSIRDCFQAPRPKDRLLRSTYDSRHTRTCSSVRRSKRAMCRKRETQHLYCGSCQSGSQAPVLLCFRHSFMPGRLKAWTIGPPSVHDAMAPAPCFLPLAAVVCTPACSTAFLVDAHFVFARRVLQCQPVLQFPLLSAACWKMTH